MSAAAVLLPLLVVGCLPRHALSRGGEVPALRYAVAGCVEAAAGEALPAERWCLEGTIDHRWTRSFRDGSMGWMVLWSGSTAREGGESRPGAVDGALLELRAFDDGRLLAVDGTAGWAGTAGHLELLDVVWPFLVPELPELEQEAVTRTTTWRVALPGGPAAIPRWTTTWRLVADLRDRAEVEARVQIDGQGDGVSTPGELDARLVVDRDRRLVEVRLTGRRVVEVRWPATTTRQAQAFEWTVTRVGAVDAPASALGFAADSPIDDAQPLRLVSGEAVRREAVDARERLPWILVSPGLDAEGAAALRARLFDE